MPVIQAGGSLRGRAEEGSASALVDEAARCAARWHDGQRGACDDTPFIAHPLEVGRLLHAGGAGDEVVAAGLLHDVLEKTTTTADELEERFGATVARLVQTVSACDGATFEAGKRDLRARVQRSGDGAALLLAADVISKLRELRRLAQRDPERFGAQTSDDDVRARLEHYLASARMLRRRLAGHRLVALLDEELTAYLGEPGRSASVSPRSVLR